MYLLDFGEGFDQQMRMLQVWIEEKERESRLVALKYILDFPWWVSVING